MLTKEARIMTMLNIVKHFQVQQEELKVVLNDLYRFLNDFYLARVSLKSYMGIDPKYKQMKVNYENFYKMIDCCSEEEICLTQREKIQLLATFQGPFDPCRRYFILISLCTRACSLKNSLNILEELNSIDKEFTILSEEKL